VEAAILVFLILLNGVFAMSEMAIVSAKRPRLKARADRGDTGAKAALKLLDDPSRMLSTVQIGITLIGVVAGAYGATAIADDLAPLLLRFAPTLGELAEPLAFGVVIVITTFLSLVLGELAPKRIALAAPERIASIAAPPMAAIAAFSAPIVFVLKGVTDALVSLVGADRLRNANVTEEEISSLIDEGREAGLIEPQEQEMIAGVMLLGDRSVRSIMTPRPEIVWLDPSATQDDNRKRIRESRHSRFPVAEGGVDHIIGVVQAKDLLTQEGGALDIAAAMRPPIIVHESISVLRLLELMRARPVRMALVADEFGAIQGLVTPSDLIEAISGAGVGASVRDDEHAVSPPVRRDDGSWLIDGMTPVEEFERSLNLSGFSGAGDYSTVAGLVIDLLQKMPETGAKASIGRLTFEIVDMDGRRIDALLVTVDDVDAAI
jgi:putative hemolysin